MTYPFANSEDNEYLFSELPGYSDDEIGEMLAEGVITTDTDLPGTQAEE